MRSANRKNCTRTLWALILPVIIAVAIVAGCGTTPLVLKTADSRIDLSQYKSLAIETSTQGFSVPGSAQARIGELVKTEVLECCAQRFQSIALDATQPHDLVLKIKFTVYDEGNRFARFMLAGLGSMQIHAQVEILDPKSGNLLSAGEAGKTFAWGGIYGASVGIEDLEKDFVKEVVKGLREALRLDGPTT